MTVYAQPIFQIDISSWFLSNLYTSSALFLLYIVHIGYLNHCTITKCILLPLKGLFTLVNKNWINVCIFSSDLLKNPLIVPVKILKGHAISHDLGVLDCVFHPSQPWVFSCGADTTIRLFTWLFTWCKGWISGRGHCIRYTKYTTSLQGLHMEEE